MTPAVPAAETAVGPNMNHLGYSGLQGERRRQHSTKGRKMGHTPAEVAEPGRVPWTFLAKLSDTAMLSD